MPSIADARFLFSLFVALGLGPVVGCDQEPEENTTDTDIDTDDMDGGESGLDPEGDGGSGGGQPPPVDAADPFDNDRGEALGALAGMGYNCDDYAATNYVMHFDADAVTVWFEDDSFSLGTYEVTATSLELSFPELSFLESTTDAAVALDALAYFETPSLRCGAFTFDHGAPHDPDVVVCPNIKYNPGISWEKNEFQFSDGGRVLRRRWTELLTVPDTLYAERTGLFRVIDDRLFIVLPFEDEGEQWLTGSITAEGVYIDQLEPEQGVCQ
jgi:hypothetical protein